MTQTTTPTTLLPNLNLFGGSQAHQNFGWYPLHPASFAPWEVALTAVLAGVLVASVVVFVRRLRRA